MAKGRVTIRISRDRLEATASIEPGEPGSRDDVLAALEAAGVGSGVMDETVERLGRALCSGDFCARDVAVARGDPPCPGRDSELRVSVRDAQTTGTERADGTLDFRARQLMTPVRAGDPIGVSVAATKGTAGRAVDGLPLPAPDGREVPSLLGPGAVLDPAGVVRAARDGVVRYRPGSALDVLEHAEHRGDVDLRSGDLETGKSLTIFGTVRRGMVVRAAEDVRVTADVDGGCVLAGGDLAVGGAVVGGGPCGLVAGRDLSARRVEGADLRCGGRLEVAGDAVACRLAGAVVVVGGRLVGGVTSAETRVQVHEVGSQGGTRTVIRAAVPVGDQVEAASRLAAEARARRGGPVRPPRPCRPGLVRARPQGSSLPRDRPGRRGGARAPARAPSTRRGARGARVRRARPRTGWRGGLHRRAEADPRRARRDGPSPPVEHRRLRHRGEEMMIDFETLRARDLMTRDLATVDAAATVRDAARRMVERGVHCLIVPSAEASGRAPGIVTSKDVVQLLGEAEPAVLDELRVADVMSRPVITAPADLAVVDCINLMRMTGVRRLLLLEGGELAGLLSYTDVLHLVAR